jgi:hypothetical protein
VLLRASTIDVLRIRTAQALPSLGASRRMLGVGLLGLFLRGSLRVCACGDQGQDNPAHLGAGLRRLVTQAPRLLDRISWRAAAVHETHRQRACPIGVSQLESELLEARTSLEIIAAHERVFIGPVIALALLSTATGWLAPASYVVVAMACCASTAR